MKTDLELHSKFQTGNVVSWCDELYIVGNIQQSSMSLLPIKGSNIRCHPSMEWPFISNIPEDPDYQVPNKNKTVDTVKFISKDIHSFIMNKFSKLLFTPKV